MVFLISCSDDEESSSPQQLILESIDVAVDGDIKFNITIDDFKSEVSGNMFEYIAEGSSTGSGTWEISEDRLSLAVSYEGKEFSFPLITDNTQGFTFQERTISLESTFSEEDLMVVLFINQQLNLSGSDWNSITNSGQTLEILFNIKF